MKDGTVLTDIFPEDTVMVDRSLCPFCDEETSVPAWDKKIVHHLVLTVDSDNHLHVHGPINDKDVVFRMLEAAKKEVEK